MSDPRAHIDRIREQFTRQADAYARTRQARDEAALSGLVALAGAAPSHRVLDVACGPGFFTLAFAARAAHATGFDATEALLERARAEATRRGAANVEWKCGDAEQLPFDGESFDVVACRAAFHHFPRPGRVLGEMARVVRKGGRVLVADMLGSDDPAPAATHDRIERLCDPTHVRALPAAELFGLFADAGLELREDRRSRIHYELGEWLAHGGPSAEAAREIRSLFEASLDTDRCGLEPRLENGALRFTHRTIALVGARPLS